MAAPLPDVMYGTPEGVALDKGAAEAARRARLIQQPGPGNPNVGPGGSAEARAWQGARAVPPTGSPAPGVPPAASAEAAGTRAGNLFSRAAGAVRGAPGAILEADVGALASRAGSAARGLATGSAARAWAPIGAGMAAHESYGTPTSEFARRTGIEQGDGQSPLLDAAKDVGIRLAGTAQNVGNVLTGGLADRLGNFIAGNGFKRSAGNQVGEVFGPGQEVGQPNAAPRPAATLPQASYSNEGRNPGMRFGPTPPASPFTDSNENGSIGKVVRDGNKFSGVNIGFNGPAGQPSEGFRQDQLELARNAAERAAAPVGGATGIGTRGTSMLDDLVNKHNASKGVDMAGLSPYDRAMMTQQQRTADKANNVSMRGQDITAQGQVINAQTAARGQDNMLTAQREGNQVSMRGQDISAGTALSGQQNSARIAAAQARMEQMNKDRDFGANQDRLTFERRQQSDKDLTTQLGSMLTTKDDKGNNVTDHAAVAEHKAGITAFLEGKIREAQSVPPSSPDYAKAQQLAERLQKEGPKALGPDRVQQLVAQISAKKANAENASSWNPLKGVQVDSSDPAAYNIVGKEKNLIFPDQYIHANGARTPSQVIDRKGGSPVFNFGAPMSTQYDSIKREGAR